MDSLLKSFHVRVLIDLAQDRENNLCELGEMMLKVEVNWLINHNLLRMMFALHFRLLHILLLRLLPLRQFQLSFFIMALGLGHDMIPYFEIHEHDDLLDILQALLDYRIHLMHLLLRLL